MNAEKTVPALRIRIAGVESSCVHVGTLAKNSFLTLQALIVGHHNFAQISTVWAKKKQ